MKKRMMIASVLTVLFAIGLIGRIGYIIYGDAYTVSEGYNSYSLLIDRRDVNLYYSNKTAITNNVTNYVAVIRPNEKDLSELKKLFSNDQVKEITEELKNGRPIAVTVDKNQYGNTKYIKIYPVKDTKTLFPQLISEQSTGLLSHVSEAKGERKIHFSVDAKGRLLSGDEGTVQDVDYESLSGLKLSIDQRVQETVYDACKNMKSGCAIVMDVKSASVLACVSKPDTTYLCKPLISYSVGSVFKIVTAVCAIENDVDLTYQCTGSITVGDTTYSCQNLHRHGVQTLKTALANSCNCYFVNLALSLGADKLLETTNALGFDGETELYDEWRIQNAHLPSREDLNSKGELALLGFGQGKLTATPLQFCSLLCTIGNGGIRQPVKLVTDTVGKTGITESIHYEDGKRVISAETAQTILEDLRYVVSDGTGRKADYMNLSAGKTATAQTGQYLNGEEIYNTWFAGVYPFDDPQYAIVILNENGSSGSADCCPVFRTIVESLD